jgi:hypothetical protein
MNMKLLAILLLILVVTAPLAEASSILDLTQKGSYGTINGAIFLQGTINPTGTGVYEPFLRLQQKGTEQGFNTDAHGVLDNKDGIWTRDLMVETIPTITVDGKQYREIRLDINESKTNKSRYLSLDSLEIYLQSSGAISNKAGLTNLKYSMDTTVGTVTVDNFVKLDYSLAPGSGWDDMTILIPESLFSGDSNPYFYLYAKFGVNFSSDAGFEEFAADPPNQVPEPATVLLLGVGLAGIAFINKRSGKL